MKKIFYLTILTIFQTFALWGQETAQERFQRRYVEAAVTLMATDHEAAHRVADSLVRVAESDDQKVRAYMLLAKIYENSGDMKNCLLKAMKADTIATVAKNYTLQASTSGYLATTFRRLGLLHTSKAYLDRAEAANDRRKENEETTLTRINIFHERAFHAVEQEDYAHAMRFLTEASSEIQQDDNDDSRTLLIKATNAQLMGVSQYKLGNLDLADSLLNSSLIMIGDVESNLKPYIYRALADVEIARGNFLKAKEYLDRVEPYLLSSQVEELKKLTYRSWAKYYKSQGNLSKSMEFATMSDAIFKRSEREARQLSGELLEDLRVSGEKHRKLNLSILWTGMALIMSAGIVALYFFHKQQEYRRMFQHLQSRLEYDTETDVGGTSNASLLNDATLAAESSDSQGKSKLTEVKISRETEARLHKQFLRLEKTHFYLEKGISLNKLASEMATNPGYVRYIIQKYRKKDFYDYVQTKRIDFIIEQLQNSPDLVRFKLSHLADLCGFTSPSTFSTAFKQVTGMPPSAFIHFLRKEYESDASTM